MSSKLIGKHSPQTAVARARLAAAGSLLVYTAAEAERRFPWWATKSREARLAWLAHAVRERVAVGVPAAFVYAQTGAVVGVAPVGGELYGFDLPGVNHRSTPDELRAGVFSLAARVTTASSRADLDAALAWFQGGPARPVAAADPAAEREWAAGTEPAELLVARLETPPPAADPVSDPRSVIGRLLATYRSDEYEHAQAPGRTRPPQPAEAAAILDGFLPLLFPGYRGPVPAAPGFDAFVYRRVSALQARLARWVRQALAFWESARGVDGGAGPAAYRAAADRAVLALFKALPAVRKDLDADIRAAYRNDPALAKGDHHPVPLCYPGVLAVAAYRLAHQLHLLEVPYLPRMLTEVAHSRTGIDIHPGAVISRGFFIDHGTGVVIGETAVIGERVTVYQGVTLGAVNFPKDDDGNLLRGAKRHPTIHRETVVYANAAVLGDIEVGRSSRIGANVSLRVSVGPESIVRVPHALREISISGAAQPGGVTPGPEPAGSSSDDPDRALPPELTRSPAEYRAAGTP